MKKKYICTLEADINWIDNFDLTFEASNENEAKAAAFMEVKQNLHDYFTVCVDEVDSWIN